VLVLHVYVNACCYSLFKNHCSGMTSCSNSTAAAAAAAAAVMVLYRSTYSWLLLAAMSLAA
jgi:hypothetical protein